MEKKSTTIKILLIGPLPDPITGLSLANQTIKDNLAKYSDSYTITSINMSYHRLERLGSFSFAKVIFYSKLYKNLFQIFNADILYITPGLTFFGVLKYAPFVYIAKMQGKEIITHIHGNYLHLEYQNASSWKKLVMRAILSQTDKGIVLSKSLICNMTPFIDKKNIYILENFVEDPVFPEKEEVKIFHTDYLRILYLSNLIPEKGIFDLLKALLILQEKNIKFTAQIAGAIDDDHKTKLREMLDKLSAHVHYLGIVRGHAKKRALMESNIFVFPTYYRMEGQPIAILEAMATGNVILTTRHAGIPDIFNENENGYYINKKDPQNIAQTLIAISDNLANQKHIMLHNQKIAAEKYTVENFIENFITIMAN
jgi:glycosyltransferase involved in cell wall biosynthesis